ncbi:DUF418 domain-containing protein [Pseudoxanthomonas sacheonensis]|uniref:DUF418 domain-containing protein n=1 Tax=Pseudoxanthomonas sacheonensis TaxID=443615 RepID=A0ABU1RRN9_9GAMM|nr:DUF418 domain-containing protein [Pseudoxanthomonas sacheonensis]MDR6841451.1 uncharacterized protein [Pseudoxanthomonas sacheonensis]
MTDDAAQTEPPAPARERHDLIDALRGFALGGVLMVNLASLTLYEFLPDAARASLPTAGFDAIALQAMELLVNIKFITLFSLLFGLGFSLQMERAQAKGGLARFVRRLLILLAIGLIHSYFIWWGDILLTYAVVGLLLVCFRHASNRVLLAAGLTLALLLPPLLSPYMREVLSEWPKQAEAYAGALVAFSSPSLTEALRGNIDMANWARVSNWALLCFVLGRFLLGYWAGRRGLLQYPHRHKVLIVRLFWWCLGIGVAMTVLQFTQAGLRQHYPLLDSEASKFLIRVLLRAGPLALGIAYATGFALLFLRPWWRRGLGVLAPMGRMALTHYLSQSLIGIGLFYAIGLGIGPRWGLAGWGLAWVAIFTTQIALSHWWLARFRFGPMEWAWRSLTYGRRQPMRYPDAGDGLRLAATSSSSARDAEARSPLS